MNFTPVTKPSAYRKAIKLEEAALAAALRRRGHRAELDVIFINQRLEVLKQHLAKEEER